MKLFKILIVIIVVSYASSAYSAVFAGGPAILRLPISFSGEGEKINCAACACEHLNSYTNAEKLFDRLEVIEGQSGSLFIQIFLKRDPFKLSSIQKDLKGSAFKIDLKRLVFFGAIRLHFKIDNNMDAIARALVSHPDVVIKTDTKKKPLDGIVIDLPDRGRHSINYGKRNSLKGDNLFSYISLLDIIKERGNELVDVSWGGRSFETWYCRNPFGAELIPEKLIETKASEALQSRILKLINKLASDDPVNRENAKIELTTIPEAEEYFPIFSVTKEK